MSAPIYSTSQVWFAVDKFADIAQFLTPVCCLLISLYLIKQSGIGRWQLIVFLGALLTFGSAMCRTFLENGVSYVTAPAPQPTIDENPLIFFLYMHGFKVGMFAFVIGIWGFLGDGYGYQRRGDKEKR